jgi:hypothetical protein
LWVGVLVDAGTVEGEGVDADFFGEFHVFFPVVEGVVLDYTDLVLLVFMRRRSETNSIP